jgi:hypothetical protein
MALEGYPDYHLTIVGRDSMKEILHKTWLERGNAAALPWMLKSML